MATITWKSPKDLGLVADSSYFEKPLIVLGVGPFHFTVISGQLPPGVELKENGILSGTPRVLVLGGTETNRIYSFTVRTVDRNGSLSDRTFSLTVSGVQALSTSNSIVDLGTYYDGTPYKYQITVNDPHLGSLISYKLLDGQLPPGITLGRDGTIEGYFSQNEIDLAAFLKLGWDQLSWDKYIYDFVRQEYDKFYQFTVELSDGENFVRQTYTLQVLARDLLTADHTDKTVDRTLIDVSRTNMHLPFVVNRPGQLPEIRLQLARQNTYFAYKFNAVDFDKDDPYFEITSPDELGFDQDEKLGWDTDDFDSSDYPMPPFIGLNNQTGWYTGQLIQQQDHRVDYQVQIYCRKPYDENLKGYRSNFIVTVLGPTDETITWVTEQNLGSIDNGLLSILRIEAVHSLGYGLEYSIKSNGGRTPQGIVLERNGMLSGRVSFNFFQFDKDTTTFDNNTATFNRLYTFTVIAKTTTGSSYSEKTFQLRINCINKKPFENLYLKGFPNKDQRQLFDSIMSRQDLFPEQLIYRPFDPYYGKAQDLRFLFVPGINPSTLNSYVQALDKNHFVKTILFGDIKTATAYDENLNVQYEVVYLDVIDEGEARDPVTQKPRAPAQSISLLGNKNYFSDGTNQYTEYNPNAVGNMYDRIIDYIGVANNNTLPAWMTSPQPDPGYPGQFLPPIGFIRAIVLAYTVPGASKLIAYRLKNAKFSFNRIPFKTDRYQLDNWLSKNYDIEEDKFLPGIETNFDIAPSRAERYRERGTVQYAVSSAFMDIQGKSLLEINDNQALDGSTNPAVGETLIFTQQTEFPANVNDYFDYIERGSVNVRASVFQITLDSNSQVVLVPIRSTNPGDIVRVLKGTTYKNQRMVFESYAKRGPFPRWTVFEDTLIPAPEIQDNLIKLHEMTTFDKNATKFVSNRDHFADLDTTGKYIKFPKNGVFI